MLLDIYREYVKPFGGSSHWHDWAMITMAAACLERRVWLRSGDYNIAPNLYTVLVGPAGSGKTFTSVTCTKILDVAHAQMSKEKHIKMAADQTTPQRMIQTMANTKPKYYFYGGQKIEYTSLFSHASELSAFISDIGAGSMVSNLLVLYDAREKDFLRDTISHKEEIVKRPSLTILGDTTSSHLARFLPAEALKEGFASRCIFVVEVVAPPHPRRPKPGDPNLRAQMAKELKLLCEMQGEFTESDEAAEFADAWWTSHQQNLQRYTGPAVMVQYYSRKLVHMAKVGMVLSAMRRKTLCIELEDYQDALALLEKIEPNLKYAAGFRDITNDPGGLMEFLGSLPNDKEFAKSELYRYAAEAGILLRGGTRTEAEFIQGLTQAGLLYYDPTRKLYKKVVK